MFAETGGNTEQAAEEETSLEQHERDVNLQWFVERGLVFDIGNHILAGAFRISVDEYERILEGLWQKKVMQDCSLA